jgi:hypothetical protein
VSTEKNIKESRRKITEVESGIQGVGNLFDNLKTVCEKNRNAVAKSAGFTERHNYNGTTIE